MIKKLKEYKLEIGLMAILLGFTFIVDANIEAYLLKRNIYRLTKLEKQRTNQFSISTADYFHNLRKPFPVFDSAYESSVLDSVIWIDFKGKDGLYATVIQGDTLTFSDSINRNTLKLKRSNALKIIINEVQLINIPVVKSNRIKMEHQNGWVNKISFSE
ncbi:MAG: hypothetical protein K1X92_01070 [Bacteroidia bacterium]|nr:hypothetical protein [Bacteroidia bacterium]